ncbi:MAG: GPI inositol-deacylase [Pseudomonadales bacterium]|nr:GPI inositol-deacylase [Pseudomonadales bacterium]
MQQRLTDLSGLSSLTIDAAHGITGIVESLHQTIPTFPGILGEQDGTSGVSSRVYRGVRSLFETMEGGIHESLERLRPLQGSHDSSLGREAALAIINGVFGDHLVKRSNPLAIPMSFRQDGKPMDKESFSEVINQSNGKIAIMIHGSCMNDLQWNRNGQNHGTSLALDLGFQPIYLHYNTGLHVSENGRELSDLLETMIGQSTQPLNMVIVGHSMGGLVSRSACYYAKASEHTWTKQLKKLVFLGTPHHGAHLEKAGNWIDTILDATRFSAPLSRLGKIRSSGVTDLRFGNVVDEDWQGRCRFESSGDNRVPVPLPEGVACYSVAATRGKKASVVSDSVVGDGLVTIDSAMGRHKKEEFNLLFPLAHQWVGRNINHFALLEDPGVYQALKGWLRD